MSVVSSRFRIDEREASLRQKAAGSIQRYERAKHSLAGGVSSGLRRSLRPFPLYFHSGSGSSLQDVDGTRYIDYMLGWGPVILGHAPLAVTAAVSNALSRGYTFGAQHDLEFEVAELIQKAVPCAERIAFANSGTEIVQVALRLARAYTGRPKYLKFEGHYHGWDDSVLVSYHPTGDQVRGQSPVPVGAGQRPESNAVVVEWNDRSAVERVLDEHAGEISAIICEPLLCNSGCIPAEPGFLAFLRDITRKHGVLLIFDEVITGFRLALGGAQEHYGVVPDLATFAKAVGGGMPFSVLAGSASVMDLIATGKVVHAGTLNGNPPVLAAAKATLEALAADDCEAFRRMWRLGNLLRDGIVQRLNAIGMDAVSTGGGPVFSVHFQARAPRTYRDTLLSDAALYTDFAVAMLDEGVALLQDGRWYLSAAHTEADVTSTLQAVDRVLAG